MEDLYSRYPTAKIPFDIAFSAMRVDDIDTVHKLIDISKQQYTPIIWDHLVPWVRSGEMAKLLQSEIKSSDELSNLLAIIKTDSSSSDLGFITLIEISLRMGRSDLLIRYMNTQPDTGLDPEFIESLRFLSPDNAREIIQISIDNEYFSEYTDIITAVLGDNLGEFIKQFEAFPDTTGLSYVANLSIIVGSMNIIKYVIDNGFYSPYYMATCIEVFSSFLDQDMIVDSVLDVIKYEDVEIIPALLAIARKRENKRSIVLRISAMYHFIEILALYIDNVNVIELSIYASSRYQDGLRIPGAIKNIFLSLLESKGLHPDWIAYFIKRNERSLVKSCKICHEKVPAYMWKQFVANMIIYDVDTSMIISILEDYRDSITPGIIRKMKKLATNKITPSDIDMVLRELNL